MADKPEQSHFTAHVAAVMPAVTSRAVGIVQYPVRSASMLGEVIRRRRKELRLNQQELADQAAVGRKLIYDVERGKPTAAIGKVFAICEALGLDLFARPR